MPFGPDAFPVWRLFSLTISMVMTKSVSSSVKLCLVGVGTGASSSLVKICFKRTGLAHRPFQKVTSSHFFTRECLSPTASSSKYHSLRVYYQVLVWMDDDPSKWEWESKWHYCPTMNDIKVATQCVINVIPCNFTTYCHLKKCSCQLYNLACISACGSCQLTYCHNQYNNDLEDVKEEP